jgi:hypothetical protein
MQSILAALEAAGVQLLSGALAAVVPVVLAWFQKLVPANPALQALSKAELRATARQWVVDFLTEMGTAALAKIPASLQPFLAPFLTPLESTLAMAIDSALDAAGL